jgi:hypothetical protein
MGLSHARSSASRIFTRLIPDKWESVLRQLGLWDQFGDVPDGLRFGFKIGAPDPVKFTFLPNNHKSALACPSVIEKHILSEITAGRYAGPYTRTILEKAIGPFRCAPLGVVDKPSDPGNFRIIQDFSYPRNSNSDSLNSRIDTEAFPCAWGFFHLVAATVAEAPPGSLGGTCDVHSAYRQIPIRPEDRPHLIVHWDNNFFLDGNVPFGAASSNGLFARCGDAMALIYDRLGFGTIHKWVDDFLFIQFPPGSHTLAVESSKFASMEAVYQVAESLGWPWKHTKTKPFASSFAYLGFSWDLESKWVSLPDQKRQKYLNRIKEWIMSAKSSLVDTERLVGCLVHCALVVPDGRPHLRALIAFTASFPHDRRLPFLKKPHPKEAVQEVDWWRARLSIPNCGSAISHPPPPTHLHVMSDASTAFGIGVIVDNYWWAWRLLQGWRSNLRDIGWAEAVGLELAIDGAILFGARDVTVTCHCDNQGVVHAWAAGRSRNPQQNIVLTRIMYKAMSAGIHVNVEYIRSADNLADAPSRGHAPKSLSPAPFVIPTPDSLLQFLAVASL